MYGNLQYTANHVALKDRWKPSLKNTEQTSPYSPLISPHDIFSTHLFFLLHYYSKYFGLIVRILGKAIMAKQDCISSEKLKGGCQVDNVRLLLILIFKKFM